MTLDFLDFDKDSSDDSTEDTSDFEDSEMEQESLYNDSGNVENENNEDIQNDTDDSEDEVVKAIKAEKCKPRDHPPSIKTEDFIVDICFHPAKNLIAIANIVGDILLYEYSNDESNLLKTLELHLKACRDVEFDNDGVTMFTTAKDKAVMATDVETGKLKQCIENAHEEPVYKLFPLDCNKIITGDDSGTVKLWDLRRQDPIFTIKIGEEYISDMVTNEAQKYLVCAGGDGMLTSIDLKARYHGSQEELLQKPVSIVPSLLPLQHQIEEMELVGVLFKIFSRSEQYEAELTCMGLFRSETKLLVGSSVGKFYLYNWKEFGFHSDEYVGQKHSIQCMIPITQNIVVSSGEDGILRAAHMFPQRQLGVVGQHSLPVEALDISHDGQYIASCSHDNDVKFWNISYFESIDSLIDVNHKQNKKKDMTNNLPSSNIKNASDFFSGLV